MKRALVAIGVNRTATVFPPLNAAAQGAIQMRDWEYSNASRWVAKALV
jgi:hypothetical protein